MLEKILNHPVVQRLVKIDTITSLVAWVYWLPTTVFGGSAMIAMIASMEHKIGFSGFVLAFLVFSCVIMASILLYVRAVEAWKSRAKHQKDFMMGLDAAVQSIGYLSNDPSKMMIQFAVDNQIEIFGCEIVGTIQKGANAGSLDLLGFTRIPKDVLSKSKIEFDQEDSVDNTVFGRSRIHDHSTGKSYGRLKVNMTKLSHLLAAVDA